MRTFDYPVYLDLRGVAGARRRGRTDRRPQGRGPRRRPAPPSPSSPPTCPPALDRSAVVEVRERPFEPADLDGARLVVTATGRADVDAAVAAAATAAGIWVNAADQPDDCSFILPAIARNGPLTVAVSTGGASPALARRLRDRAGALLTDDVVALAADLQARRAEVRGRRRLDRGRRLVRPDRPRAPADLTVRCAHRSPSDGPARTRYSDGASGWERTAVGTFDR